MDASPGVNSTRQEVDITSQYNAQPPLTPPTEDKPRPASTPDTKYPVNVPVVSVTKELPGSLHNKPSYNTTPHVAPYVTNTDDATKLTPRKNISKIPCYNLSGGSMEELPSVSSVSMCASQSQRYPMESIDTKTS